jgi:Na+/H+ antiporter NhaD/arsenite permease-like protein
MDITYMILCLVVFVFVIATVIRPPKFSLPERWRRITLDLSISPVIGVIFLMASHTITPHDVFLGIYGNEHIAPWQIMILFYALAYICVSLDSCGGYTTLALKAVDLSRGSGIVKLT